MSDEDVTGPQARADASAVGQRLRSVREGKGLSLQQVEQQTAHYPERSVERFKASVLGAYERGERAMSVSRLYALARVYGVDPWEMLASGQASEAVVTVTVTAAGSPEAAAAVVAAIQAALSDQGSSGRPVVVNVEAPVAGAAGTA